MNTLQPVEAIYNNQGTDRGINTYEDRTSLEWLWLWLKTIMMMMMLQ
jgi:hypothetical protein